MKLMKSNLPFFPTLPQFFDDFFTKDFSDWGVRPASATNTTIPAVNVIEFPDQFAVEMAAPGMNKKDFQIELENEILKISSAKTIEEELPEGSRFTRREFSYQSFERHFHLPKTVVDDARIKAEYKDGVLRILIPKKEEAKALPPRRIDIK